MNEWMLCGGGDTDPGSKWPACAVYWQQLGYQVCLRFQWACGGRRLPGLSTACLINYTIVARNRTVRWRQRLWRRSKGYGVHTGRLALLASSSGRGREPPWTSSDVRARILRSVLFYGFRHNRPAPASACSCETCESRRVQFLSYIRDN